MALNSYFDSLGKLWRKAEREGYRAFHAKRAVDQADHFFNFCVTSHSLRDYFLKHAGASGAAVQRYHDRWNAEPVVVAAKDIANLSKHFELKKPPTTRGSRRTRSDMVSVYQAGDETLRLVPTDAPDIIVRLSDGTLYQLYEFTAAVLEYWRDFLRSEGIRVRRQTVAELLGHPR